MRNRRPPNGSGTTQAAGTGSLGHLARRSSTGAERLGALSGRHERQLLPPGVGLAGLAPVATPCGVQGRAAMTAPAVASESEIRRVASEDGEIAYCASGAGTGVIAPPPPFLQRCALLPQRRQRLRRRPRQFGRRHRPGSGCALLIDYILACGRWRSSIPPPTLSGIHACRTTDPTSATSAGRLSTPG
jgi:hypothetical protein